MREKSDPRHAEAEKPITRLRSRTETPLRPRKNRRHPWPRHAVAHSAQCHVRHFLDAPATERRAAAAVTTTEHAIKRS